MSKSEQSILVQNASFQSFASQEIDFCEWVFYFMLKQGIFVAVFLKQNFPQSEDYRFCTALSTTS